VIGRDAERKGGSDIQLEKAIGIFDNAKMEGEETSKELKLEFKQTSEQP